MKTLSDLNKGDIVYAINSNNNIILGIVESVGRYRQDNTFVFSFGEKKYNYTDTKADIDNPPIDCKIKEDIDYIYFDLFSVKQALLAESSNLAYYQKNAQESLKKIETISQMEKKHLFDGHILKIKEKDNNSFEYMKVIKCIEDDLYYHVIAVYYTYNNENKEYILKEGFFDLNKQRDTITVLTEGEEKILIIEMESNFNRKKQLFEMDDFNGLEWQKQIAHLIECQKDFEHIKDN